MSLLFSLVVLGFILGIFLFLSPIMTFIRIIREKSTGEFSSLMYILTLLSCLLSAWYAMPFITHKNYPVAILNGIGALIAICYIAIFLVYAPKREKIKITILLIFVITIILVIALVSIMVYPKTRLNKRQQLCGFANMGLSILLYASPLSIMRTVVKTKSVEYMPFLPSLSIFLFSTNWMIYGFMRMDKFIYFPNTLGCILGAMQLIIYACYRNKGRNNALPAPDYIIENGHRREVI